MSLNQSFNISLNSMFNNQYALTVVSQNIANVHVEGYHRQRVDFQTNPSTTSCKNVIDTIKGMNGAHIAGLTGFVDDAAYNDVLGANSDANYYNDLANALKGLEDITDDLGDNGLNGLLNDFYTAAANLEQFPTDIAIRQQYIQAAQNICEKFNDISKKCNNLIDENIENTNSNVNVINSLLNDLADANKEHVKTNESAGTQKQIEEILSELSNYVDIKTDKNKNGSYNLYIGSQKVVEGGKVNYEFKAGFDKNNPNKIASYSLVGVESPHQTIDITDSINSGSLKAQSDFLNGTSKSFGGIREFMSALDTAAGAFAAKLNDIQTFDDGADCFAAGLKTVDGELRLERTPDIGKVPMFTTKDGSTNFSASNIEVNDLMFENPYYLATARVDASLDPNWEKAVGNSDNANLITATQNEKFVTYKGNSFTLSNFLINNASAVGLDTAQAQNKADIANDILTNSINNYNNLIGVNLDEELADMIRYQRAYEASAKVFTTVNDLIGVILNMV